MSEAVDGRGAPTPSILSALAALAPKIEPVALIVDNSPKASSWVLSALQAGYPIAVLDARLRPWEIADALTAADPRVVVKAVTGAIPELPPRFRPGSALDGPETAYWRREPRGEEDWRAQWGTDALVAQLTSGSTGPSLLAVRTAGGVEQELRAVSEQLHLEPSDRILCVSSIAHSYAFYGGLLAGARAGATVALAQTTRHASALLETFRPTVVFGLGLFYRWMLDAGTAPQWAALSRARLLFTAGGPVPADLLEEWSTRGGPPLRQDYGTTETGTISLDVGDQTHPESVGRRLPHMHVRSLDGEIQVKSLAVASRYLERNAWRPVASENGWYLTGDLGTVDDGHIRLAGRRREVVVTPSGPIALADLEREMKRLPGVAGISAFRVALRDGSAAVRAVVVPMAGTDFRKHLDRLPTHLIPQEIEVRESLPTTPAGKVLVKYLLRT